MESNPNEAFKSIFPNSEPEILVTIGCEGNLKSWAVPNESSTIKQLYNIGNETHFIHYTSVDSLFAIINSCQLRLYNLFTLNDPQELKFALADFGFKLSEDDYYRFKQQTFITSLCSYNMVEQNEDYNLWRFYGRDGYGAALVFEIENYNSEWNDYDFGKVQYGTDNEAFKKLKLIAEYYRGHENDPMLLPSLIIKMCMLHKHQVWKIENEYRLFANCSYNDNTFRENVPLANYFLLSSLNHYITDKGEKGAFTCLPFNLDFIKEQMTFRGKERDIESYFNMFPHLKFKRAIIGYNVSQSKTNQIIDYGSKLASAKLGYSVEFLESKFKKEFK